MALGIAPPGCPAIIPEKPRTGGRGLAAEPKHEVAARDGDRRHRDPAPYHATIAARAQAACPHSSPAALATSTKIRRLCSTTRAPAFSTVC